MTRNDIPDFIEPGQLGTQPIPATGSVPIATSVTETATSTEGSAAQGTSAASAASEAVGSSIDTNTSSVVSVASGSWVPPVLKYARQFKSGLFGSDIVAPIASKTDPWCEVELLADSPTVYVDKPDCQIDIVRQGNFSTKESQLVFRDFQLHNRTAHLGITVDQRRAYWAKNPEALTTVCDLCAGSMQQQPVYRQRRWWAITSWTKVALDPSGGGKSAKTGSTFLLLNEDRIEGRYGFVAGHYASYNKKAPPIDSLLISDIRRIVFCNGEKDKTETHLRFETKAGDWLHYVRFVLPWDGSFRSFVRTVQILLPDKLPIVFHESGGCNVHTREKTDAVVSKRVAVPVVAEAQMPYIPCHRFGIDEIMNAAVDNQIRTVTSDDASVRKKLKGFTMWPFKCTAFRDASACDQAAHVRKRSQGVRQTIRVAVAISGFVRSFANARQSIERHMVQPHGATAFGVTWNVVGRTKKTAVVKKEQQVSVGRMYATISGFMGIGKNENITRLVVMPYFRVSKMLDAARLAGFQQPGLYYTVANVLKLVVDSKMHFDVVIRTRFDVFPAVPLRFVRMAGPDEYALDLGSQCLMDGMWWPQWAKFGEGKLLKHYADTRMKYFSWQVCDWIEIGTFRTVTATTGLYDWVQANNVFSAAQFVEHAFYVDQNITYQPLQLYLKIMRHRGHFFG